VVVVPTGGAVVVTELDVVLEVLEVLEVVSGLAVVLGPLPDRLGAPLHAAVVRAITAARATSLRLAGDAKRTDRPDLRGTPKEDRDR
jgi:hypothetical protein